MSIYRIYFSGTDSSGKDELWVSNGTVEGTDELTVVSSSIYGDFDPVGLTQFGNSILFAGIDSSIALDQDGDYNLFLSNGTGPGTTELLSAGAGSGGLFSFPEQEPAHGPPEYFAPGGYIVLGHEAIFAGVDTDGDLQLWSTNGTSAGTVQIVVPGEAANTTDPYHSGGLQPTDITPFGINALFFGNDSSGRTSIWITNGTAAGTSELLPAGASSSGVAPPTVYFYGAEPQSIAVISPSLALFAGIDAAGLSGLWATNGTSAGTTEIAVTGAQTGLDYSVYPLGIPYGVYGLAPTSITAFGAKALFDGYDSSGRNALWITDGTTAGTQEILPTAAILTSSGLFGSQMLFVAAAADGSEQLWTTNGTSAGTKQLTTAAEGAFLPNGTQFAVIGNEALFGGFVSAGGQQIGLWATNGTATGTNELQPSDANQGEFGLEPGDLTVDGSQVVFTGFDTTGNDGLWISNGTSASTSELQVPGLSSPSGYLVTVSSQTTITGSPSGGSDIYGTGNDDYLIGHGLDNMIYAYGGNDIINPGSGSDTVYAALDGSVGSQGASPGDGGVGLDDTINLQGSNNVIYGGDENFTIVGGTGNNSVAVASGDNLISLFGADNQVLVGGGVNTVRFTGGTATLTVVDFGQSFPPPVSYNLTVLFAGNGNTLINEAGLEGGHSGFEGDPGTLSVTGGTGGGNFDLGWSTANLVTGGSGNVIKAGQGTSTITPGSGGDTVDLVASEGFDQVGGNVTVFLSGLSNVVQGFAHSLTVTGGNGYSTFDLAGYSQYSYSGLHGLLQRSYSITTSGNHNSFELDGGFSNTINTGYGYAHVSIANPNTGGSVVVPLEASSIIFGYGNNTLTGGDADISATGGTGSSTYTLGDGNDSISTGGASNVIILGNGNDTVVAGFSQDSVTTGNGNDMITIAGNDNLVMAGDGNDTIMGSASNSHVTAGDGTDIFRLTGLGNTLKAGNGNDNMTFISNANVLVAGNGNDTVTGGSASNNNSVTLGSGNDTVQLGGWGNSIGVGTGTDTLNGGLGSATITLNGSNASLTLQGRANTATLNASTHAVITDQSSDLLLKVTASDVHAEITGFGVSTGAVLDLLGAAGGSYTSTQQVLAALTSDGHGGSILALGTIGSIDFVNLATSAFHAANFQV